jgi:PAS domain-containing protein
MPGFKDLWRILEPFLKRLWEALLSLFQSYPARMALAATLFVAAIVSASFYVDRSQRYQEIVSGTVRSEMERTPQGFKVLEAFILSTVDRQLPEYIKTARLSTDFARQLDALDAELASPTKTAPAGLMLAKPDYVSAQKPQDIILTDNADTGFLFFPLNLLRADTALFHRGPGGSAPGDISRPLLDAVAHDGVIADDIELSRRLLPILQGFTLVPVLEKNPWLTSHSVDTNPAQIYYITKNGLNRIVNKTKPAEQRTVYRNMFRATTFFPSRPYFVEAFRLFDPGSLKGLSGETSRSFYVSQPYLDIGGFGVVVTLARPLRYPNHSDAALCFDLLVEVDNFVEFQLTRRLASFGAEAQYVKCDIGLGGLGDVKCLSDRGGDYSLRQALENKLRQAMTAGALSSVAGDINILNDEAPRTDIARAGVDSVFTYPLELVLGYNARPISFAMPLREPRALTTDRLSLEFLVSSLNLERFSQITSLLGLSSAAFLMSAFFILILSFERETRKRRDFEDAFRLVETVMYGAGDAYCRLDSKDRIVDCNIAFCDLLQFPAERESIDRLKGQTFESQLSPRSKNTYHAIQAKRLKSEQVEPYTLFFLRRDGSEIETRITSGVLPGRRFRDLPSTFGIIIAMPGATVSPSSAAR